MSIQHIIDRARDRYGLTMTVADVTALANKISSRDPGARNLGPMRYMKDAKLGEPLDEKWSVNWKGVAISVVWDSTHQRIKTLMPPPGKRGAMTLGQVARVTKAKPKVIMCARLCGRESVADVDGRPLCRTCISDAAHDEARNYMPQPEDFA